MPVVRLILSAKRQLFRFLLFACAACLAVVFSTTLLQIFMRKVLYSPLVWAEDLAVFLFIWITFLGAAVLFDRKILISIDSVVTLLPPPFQRACHVISNVIIVISMGYLLHLSWLFMLRQQLLGHNLGGALSVPSWVVMIPVIIAFAGMIMSSLASVLSWIEERDADA